MRRLFAGMLISAFSAGAFAQTAPETPAPAPARIAPFDEARKDPSFYAFRGKLLDIVDARDTSALLDVVAPDIKWSFGDDNGRDAFAAHWNLGSPDSQFWRALKTVLALGGGMEGQTFTAPYVFAAAYGGADVFSICAVTAPDVRFYATADEKSRVLRTLDYDVLTVLDESVASSAQHEAKPDAWTNARDSKGTVGWLRRRDCRSPIDYRARFEVRDGKWAMTLFIAGD